jgi:integrase
MPSSETAGSPKRGRSGRSEGGWPWPATLYALALDSGARKNELCGLQWGDIDFEKGTVTFVRQLTKTGRNTEFGPLRMACHAPSTWHRRRLTCQAHKRAQAELKMRNRTATMISGWFLGRNGAISTPAGFARAPASVPKPRAARVRADSAGGERAADYHSRITSHERHTPAEGRRAGASRTTAFRS